MAACNDSLEKRWIPAFAGMTKRWIPAFAGMTQRETPGEYCRASFHFGLDQCVLALF